jgi:hypothetical protein
MHSHVRTALLCAPVVALAFFVGTASVRGADPPLKSATASAPRAMPLVPLSLPVYTALPTSCTAGQMVLLQSDPSSSSIQLCVQHTQRGGCSKWTTSPTRTKTCVADLKACQAVGGMPDGGDCRHLGVAIAGAGFSCLAPTRTCAQYQTTTILGWMPVWTSPTT